MKIELRGSEGYPMIEAGDLLICEYGLQYLVGTDGDYFKLISIDEHECEITEEVYTPESLMKELDELGLQRIVRSENFEEDHTYYLDGEKVDTSVTEAIHGKRDLEEWGGPASALGNSADGTARTYFQYNGAIPDDYVVPNATPEQRRRFIENLDALKEYLDNRFGIGKYKVITDEFPIGGVIHTAKGDVTVAGTMDMLVFDETGNLYIFDFKTKRDSGTGSDLSDYTKEGYDQQVNIYRQLIEANYPEFKGKVHIGGLIKFAVEYPRPTKDNYRMSPDKEGQLQYRPYPDMDYADIQIATNEYEFPYFYSDESVESQILPVEVKDYKDAISALPGKKVNETDNTNDVTNDDIINDINTILDDMYSEDTSDIDTDDLNANTNLIEDKTNYTAEEQHILNIAKRNEEGKLLAPNGKVSNLTEKQYAQVRTKAFKEWFGDWEKEYTPPRQYDLSTWERTGEYVDVLEKDFLGNTYSASKEILSHPVERKETTKEDPFGFNSIGVSKVIKIGTLVNRENPLNGICQYTAQRIQAFLKDRYGIEVHTNIIDAKSPVTGEIITHHVAALTIDGKPYIYDMPQTEFISTNGNTFNVGNKEYKEAVITKEYSPRLIEITKESLLKNYGDSNDIQISVIKGTAKLSGNIKSSDIEASYIPAYSPDVSKVVDENGEPLVVYHGTDYKNDHTIIGDWSKNALPYATYFAPYRGYSQFEYVYQAFLNIRNPIYSDIDLTEDAIQYKSIFDKYIINKGHDGAISGTRDFTKEIPSNALEAKEIVVTYPNQIKSATDNEGGFSRTNDNIYKRHGEDRDRHLYSRERAVKYIKDQGYTIDNLVHDTYETRFEVTLKAKVKEDIWR